jgi:hypothetical protein
MSIKQNFIFEDSKERENNDKLRMQIVRTIFEICDTKALENIALYALETELETFKHAETVVDKESIQNKAFVDMPMASERTQTAYSTLEKNFNDYIESLQETAFYHGYVTGINDAIAAATGERKEL